MKSKKFLSVILVVLMIISAVFSASISSYASYGSDKTTVFEFSSTNHNYSKTEGCNPNNSWAWGTFATTTFTHNSDGSADVNITAGDYNYFRQLNSNWKNVPAESSATYIDITNNTTRLIKAKITVGGYTTPADSELPQINAGETITIELGALTGGSVQILLLDGYGEDKTPCGENAFSFSPIYTDTSDGEETTVNTTEETTINTSGKEVVYPFVSANHNFSKTEGCNPNASWAWGSFATTAIACNSDGSANLNVTAGAYDKYRQLQSNWNNVPAESSTTYIDISNNTTRRIKVKITVAGYTTPDDSALPYVKSGETLTIELGALTGGTLKILILDEYGQDQIPCGENAFTFSGIYKKSEEPTAPTLYDVNLDGETYQISAGSQFDLPMNEDADFVGYFDGTNFYNSSESITVNEPMIISSVSFTLSMESGASIRYSDPTGMRFYTNLDKDTLAWLEESGATVQLGTIISPADLLGTENLSLDMSAKYIDVPFEVRDWFVEDDFSGFVGSIAKIKTENLNRNFVGRGYAKITFGDFEKTVYASYADNDISNNSRTICYIANALKNSDTYNSLTDARKAIVDSYASSYAE